MRCRDLGRYAPTCCVAAALLAGCGGVQPPIVGPGGMPQGRAGATNADDGRSWMLPEAESKDLLYLGSNEKAYVFTYPQGKRVGALALPASADYGAFCADRQRHVFVVARATDYPPFSTSVYEYAHEQSTPLRTLTATGSWGWDCSVDPCSGDLALSGMIGSSKNGGVEIFSKAQGNPTLYRDRVKGFAYCGYDPSGNLYVDGFTINNRLGIAVL